MREGLNLESGLNDGICVPIVVILLGLAVGTQIEGGTMGHVFWVVVEEIGIRAIGLALTCSPSGCCALPNGTNGSVSTG
jgi:sodium/hydrogen antiporter